MSCSSESGRSSPVEDIDDREIQRYHRSRQLDGVLSQLKKENTRLHCLVWQKDLQISKLLRGIELMTRKNIELSQQIEAIQKKMAKEKKLNK